MTETLSRGTLLRRGAAGLVGAAGLPGALGASAYAEPARRMAGHNFSIWYASNSATLDAWIKKDFASYEKAHPDVHLDISKRPLDSIDRLIATSLKASRGPDLIGTPGASYVATYADAGYLRRLDDYVKQYGWKDKLLPWALRAGELGGHVYSVPTSYETMVIYYNKKLFADRGLKIPTNRQQLEALCQDLADHGITPFMAGSAEWRPATEWFVTVFLNHYAGPKAVYEALSGKRPWTDPVFVDAITLMRDWFKKGWFGGGVDRYFSNRFAPQYANFGTGKAAMDLEGSWALVSMPDYFGSKAGNDADWDWFPVPPLSSHAPKTLYTLATGGTYSVNAKAKDPGAIGAYLDWLFSTPKRVAQGVADINNEPLPIHLKPSDFPASTDKRVLRMYADIGKATGHGVFGYTTWTFWGPKSDVWSYQGMDKVLTGSQSPSDYLRRMGDLMKAELKQKKLPPLVPQGPAA
jgi:raffinose/stachyose/melibiose transport system substrate-binding protein